MNSTEVKTAATRSIKWSLLGEIFAKISAPLSMMVLARLLTPDIFGITTAVTIIVSFCETVTESGFAKYIIQHDFKSEDDYNKHFSLSFYISLILSILLCLFVFLLRNPLSAFVGNSGYEMVLVVSCAQVPFATINALYSADLRRLFQFKKLFIIRIIYCVVPFAITIPLALLGFGYWSLVIGTIASQILQCPFLIIVSRRGAKPFFSIPVFLETIKNSFPMILESIIIWMCTWCGTVIAANFFNSSVVGIVKVSSSTVNSIFTLFATAFTSVLFPALSRLKNDENAYQETFYSIQGSALSVLIPIGIGAYFYAQLITDIFLGSNWQDAVFVIAVYSLTRPLMICFNNFMSEVFRSKGHFYSSMIYQLTMLGADLILKFTVGKMSYDFFIWTTVYANLFTTILAISILKFKYKFSVIKQFGSLIPSLVCSLIMIPLILFGTSHNTSLMISIAQVLASATLYFASLSILFPKVLENLLVYIRTKRV